MIRNLILTCLIITFSWAEETPKSNATPKTLSAINYNLENQKSSVTLRITHSLMGQDILGRFDTTTTNAMTGHLTVSPEGKITASNIKVDLSKLSSQVKIRDEHMKNKSLKISEFPFAELTNFESKLGDLSTGVVAKIKVRGVEVQLKDVKSRFEIKDNLLNGDVQFKVKYGDFKIEKPEYWGMSIQDELEVLVLLSGAPEFETVEATPFK